MKELNMQHKSKLTASDTGYGNLTARMLLHILVTAY